MKITPEQWQGAIRLAIQQEDNYAIIDGLDLLDSSEEISNAQEAEVEESPEIPEQAQDDKDNNALKCSNCSQAYKTAKALSNHVARILNCAHCPMKFCGFKRQSHLNVHKKKEHDFSPKKCSTCHVCKKSFEFPSQLKFHLVKSKCGREKV